MTNDWWNVFARDRQTGSTELISVSSNGQAGNGNSQGASISGDGRYVVFESKASNLDSIDSDVQSDVYIHDRVTNTTALVSRAYDGGPANGASGAANISADGQYIVFQSGSSDLLVTPTGISQNHIYRVMNPLATSTPIPTPTATPTPTPTLIGGASKLIFSKAGPPKQLSIINSDGTNKTLLTNSAIHPSRPSLSPDGSKILFTSDKDQSQGEIYVIDTDGSNETRLTFNSYYEEGRSWSPDGAKIVYSITEEVNGKLR